MNCFYCNKEVKMIIRHSICYNCQDSHITLSTYYKLNDSVNYWYLTFPSSNNKYYEIFMTNNPGYLVRCRLDEFGQNRSIGNWSKTILTLHYVPDISPSTAQNWIDKILNLKAFL